VEKPANLTSEEAAGLGVPFVTATEGFRRSGMPMSGDNVLILGLNGKVGQAAAQIAAWKGARVMGVVRRDEPFAGYACSHVEVINSATSDVPTRVREITGGKGADIVYNTVGDPYYEHGAKSLAIQGRMIFISAINKIVQFDIFAFYRGRHTYYGADSLSLSSIATGEILRELLPAYIAVLGSARDRLVFKP
jgi:NADPH:quinone reductase